MTPRFFLSISLLGFAVVGGGIASCKGCDADNAGNNSSGTTTAASASSSSASSSTSAAPSAQPYLPTRQSADVDPNAPTSIVEDTVFQLRPQLNQCYRQASASNPKLEASFVFALTIRGDGTVSDVAIEKRDSTIATSDPALVECTKQALKSAKFKATPDGGVAKLNVPINFRPPPPSNTAQPGVVVADGGGIVLTDNPPPRPPAVLKALEAGTK